MRIFYSCSEFVSCFLEGLAVHDDNLPMESIFSIYEGSKCCNYAIITTGGVVVERDQSATSEVGEVDTELFE